MAKHLTYISVDENMRETTEHGSAAFPFEYYIDEILKFDNQSIEWHWHTELEWLYVEKGSIECCAGAERIVLQEGDGLFINSRVIHHFEERGVAVMPNILFLPSLLAAEGSAVYQEWVLPVLQSARSCFLLRRDDPAAEQVLLRLRNVFGDADKDAQDRMQIWLSTAELWHCFVKTFRDDLSRKGSPRDILLQSRVRRMMQYIQEHYGENVTLEQIAQAANVSRSEALRCFHTQLQKAPVEYLIEFRLARARQLLFTTNDTVSQIASAVGMENISYFIRAFKARYGTTPGACRRQNLL